jgi:hypothetical protein
MSDNQGAAPRPSHHPPITLDALDRVACTARRDLDALDRLLAERHQETNRRLADLNNSHERATNEKRRTDEAALRVHENSVTKADLQAWKDEVNRRLDTAAGAATARAAIMSGAIGCAVLVLNLIIRFFTTPAKP